MKDQLYFYGSYFRPTQSNRDNAGQPLRRAADYDSTRNEGFGKLTFTPTQSILLNASYRDSKRVETGDAVRRERRRRPPAPATRRGSRSSPPTARGSINTRSFVTLQVHALREPDAGPSGPRADVVPSTAPGTAARRRQPRHAGPAHRARAGRGQTRLQRLRAAAHRPLRLRRRTASHVGGGIVGLRAASSTTTTSSATPCQLGYNLTLGTSVIHELHFGYQYLSEDRGPAAHPNGWGADLGAGRPRRGGERPAALLHRRASSSS